MPAALDADARTNLQERINELDGVLHAGINAGSSDLWVVRDPAYDQGPIELAIRNRIAALGLDIANLAIRVTLPAGSAARRRVRFETLERDEDHGRVTITVGLEWDGRIHTGSASADKGSAIELRTTARAAVDALERLTGQDLELRIIGVKPIHAFDTDLMVASLIRAGAGQQRLVGAVVVSEGALQAAAVAVLSALNRTLGNFLHTPG